MLGVNSSHGENRIVLSSVAASPKQKTAIRKKPAAAQMPMGRRHLSEAERRYVIDACQRSDKQSEMAKSLGVSKCAFKEPKKHQFNNKTFEERQQWVAKGKGIQSVQERLESAQRVAEGRATIS